MSSPKVSQDLVCGIYQVLEKRLESRVEKEIDRGEGMSSGRDCLIFFDKNSLLVMAVE